MIGHDRIALRRELAVAFLVGFVAGAVFWGLLM